MDWMTLPDKGMAFFKKYKYVIIILAVGIFLMLLPSGSEERPAAQQTPALQVTQSPEERLEEILSKIEGVGKVRVMLTEASGSETIFQTDEDCSDSGEIRIETVIITGEDRAQNGLIKRVDPPAYLGAIVVCQGAERPSVKLALVEAVSNVTGIGADRITVLKMK